MLAGGCWGGRGAAFQPSAPLGTENLLSACRPGNPQTLSRLVTSKVIVTLPDLKKKGRSHLLKTFGGKLGKFEYEPVLGNIED